MASPTIAQNLTRVVLYARALAKLDIRAIIKSGSVGHAISIDVTSVEARNILSQKKRERVK